LQPAVFIDSTGRTYCLPAHTLASARGQGEPLSGRLNPPDGARFTGVMMGEPEDLWLLASDAGYGFAVRLQELITDRRAGKRVLNVPAGAAALPPVPIPAADALVVLVGSTGKLLAFAVSEVPEMAHGKGNKLYDLGSGKSAERVVALTVVAPRGALGVWSADKQRSLSWSDLQAYRSERARRGLVLPRGWPRSIERLDALPPA
jgi:topoisomerase-4 subunit A